MTWERIEAGGRGAGGGRRHLVYWRHRLEDGTWYSVKRTSTTAAFCWEWVHHLEPGPDGHGAEGAAMSSVTARRLADEHADRYARRLELKDVLEKSLKDRRSTSDTKIVQCETTTTTQGAGMTTTPHEPTYHDEIPGDEDVCEALQHAERAAAEARKAAALEIPADPFAGLPGEMGA